MPLPREEFVRRWKIASLTERASAQSHFLDLCDMLGEPHPAAADAVGERYTFEKPVARTSGGKGFADVWLRDHFAWEYKSKNRDLKAAYQQLNDYHEDLGNPPLLVVCDFDRFEIHTKWTSTRTRVYTFNLDDLKRNTITAACPLPPLDVLRALFGDVNALLPTRTDAFVTQEAAKVFARLAERLEIEKRSLTDTPIHTREEIAHFLMRLLFCLFADNIGLLPGHLFRRLIQSDDRFRPTLFLRKLQVLFEAMAEPEGIFGEHTILHFNGGLFDSDKVISLDNADLGILHEASTNYDWSHVAPEIFGTLFERSLNKQRRSLIGAHYTSAEDILLLIEPVVMAPLQRRWEEAKQSILLTLGTQPTGEAAVIQSASEGSRRSTPRRNRPDLSPHNAALLAQPATHPASPSLLTSNPAAEALLAAWFDSLAAVRILDPACGSGNFLYLALRRLLDLWNQARVFAIEHGIQIFNTYAIEKMPSPGQLFGIETEFYAHELASIVVWIGFLQWKREHGIVDNPEPILQKLSNIEHNDAILRYDAQGKPYEPAWPKADFIIGNPPFLGDKKMRRELDIDPHPTYTADLRKLYEGRVPGGADLVAYWFDKAGDQIAKNKSQRAGLLATQGIRGGANRTVLERIVKAGGLFMAWADRPWILEGAAVRVSMIGFDDGTEMSRMLDGKIVDKVHSNLTSEAETTSAFPLPENAGLSFIGPSPHGRFDIDFDSAQKMLAAPINVNGRPNSDVVRPVANAIDLVRGFRNVWTIDFGADMALEDAAMYEMPFEFVRATIYPRRKRNHREAYRDRWWIYGEARPGMRKGLASLTRFIASPRVSKHRIFVWQQPSVLCNDATVVFAREDDYFFGILHSSTHELWARAQGTQLREVESGFRYTPNSTFDTFPFPWPPGTEPSEAGSPLVKAIAEAARELVRLRDLWLNPPGASAEDLKSRTLTRLYNLRSAGQCAWLENAHRTLDEAVFAAYGWPPTLSTQEILAQLLALNHQRAATQNEAVPRSSRRRLKR